METNMTAIVRKDRDLLGRKCWFVEIGLPMCNLPYRVEHRATFNVVSVPTRREARAIVADKRHPAWVDAEARRDRFGRY